MSILIRALCQIKRDYLGMGLRWRPQNWPWLVGEQSGWRSLLPILQPGFVHSASKRLGTDPNCESTPSFTIPLGEPVAEMPETLAPGGFSDTTDGGNMSSSDSDNSDAHARIKHDLRQRINRENRQECATKTNATKKRKATSSKSPGANAASTIIFQAGNFLHRVVNAIILEPLGRVVGEVLKYVLATTVLIVVVIVVLRYAVHSLPDMFTGNVSLALRWLGSIYHVPTSLWCMYVGIGCPVSPPDFKEIKNVTFSANEQVRQASKVINNLDKLSPSRNELMSQSVGPCDATC